MNARVSVLNEFRMLQVLDAVKRSNFLSEIFFLKSRKAPRISDVIALV